MPESVVRHLVEWGARDGGMGPDWGPGSWPVIEGRPRGVGAPEPGPGARSRPRSWG